MPTYEYQCSTCKEKEVLSRNVDDRDNEVTCSCGNIKTRIYNAVPIKFNGSGFYSTGG